MKRIRVGNQSRVFALLVLSLCFYQQLHEFLVPHCICWLENSLKNICIEWMNRWMFRLRFQSIFSNQQIVLVLRFTWDKMVSILWTSDGLLNVKTRHSPKYMAIDQVFYSKPLQEHFRLTFYQTVGFNFDVLPNHWIAHGTLM